MGAPKDDPTTTPDDEAATGRRGASPPAPVEQTDHPVGEEQAAENRDEESPA